MKLRIWLNVLLKHNMNFDWINKYRNTWNIFLKTPKWINSAAIHRKKNLYLQRIPSLAASEKLRKQFFFKLKYLWHYQAWSWKQWKEQMRIQSPFKHLKWSLFINSSIIDICLGSECTSEDFYQFFFLQVERKRQREKYITRNLWYPKKIRFTETFFAQLFSICFYILKYMFGEFESMIRIKLSRYNFTMQGIIQVINHLKLWLKMMDENVQLSNFKLNRISSYYNN